MKVESRLVQRHNDKTDREEWALISKKSGRVLKWFGAEKPSEKSVAEEEQRIQYWKHHSFVYPTLARIIGSENDEVYKLEDFFSPGEAKQVEPAQLKEAGVSLWYKVKESRGYEPKDTSVPLGKLINVFDPSQRVSGKQLDITVVAVDSDENVIGSAYFIGFPNVYGKVVAASKINVTKDFRKLGIARSIYDLVKSLGYKVEKSSEQTEDGQAMWKALDRAESDIVDDRFEEEPYRQQYRDALPFQGPWNGYDQMSPIEKVYPAISWVLGRTPNPNKYPMLSRVLADIIDERYSDPHGGYRHDSSLPIQDTYGWGWGQGPGEFGNAVENNPMGQGVRRAFATMRAFAKATLPPDSELMHFYNLADREAWVDEQREEGERQFTTDIETKEEKDELAREMLAEGYNGWDAKSFKAAPLAEKEQAIKDFYVSQWIHNEEENANSSEVFFEDAQILSNPTLVRYTDHVTPEQAMAPGFKFLGHGPDNLGLTAGGGIHERHPGGGDLAFAFDKKDLKTRHDWEHGKGYGKYAYEFKVPYAVKAYHISDGEDQVVFDVNTVRDLKVVDLNKATGLSKEEKKSLDDDIEAYRKKHGFKKNDIPF